MASVIVCSSCTRKLRIPDEMAGKRIKCPACGTLLTAVVVEDVIEAEPHVDEEEDNNAPEPRRQTSRRRSDADYEEESWEGEED